MSEANVWQPRTNCKLVASTAIVSYTLTKANNNMWMDLLPEEDAEEGITITLPAQGTLDLGSAFVHIVTNYSDLPATIVGEEGVTIVTPAGLDANIAQHVTVVIKKADAMPNTYVLCEYSTGEVENVIWGNVIGSVTDQTDLTAFVTSRPHGDLMFSEVATLKSATALNITGSINWANYLGRKATVIVNNSTSNEGGAPYVILNSNPGNLSTLVGGIWIGANHDLGGGFYAKIDPEFARLTSFGATGNTTDSSYDAAQRLFDYCKTEKIAANIDTDMYADQQLVIACDVLPSTATIYTDTGVIIGDDYALGTPTTYKGLQITLPKILTKTVASPANTYLAGVGVDIVNVNESKILLTYVGREEGGWEIGHRMIGRHAGCAWNEVTILELRNNRINVKHEEIGTSGDPLGDGFCNQNTVYLIKAYKKPHNLGGSVDLSSHHIYVDGINSTTFIHPSVEVDTFTGRPGLRDLIVIKNSSEIKILNAHAESPVTSRIVFDNSEDCYVSFDGAAIGSALQVVEINGAGFNEVDRGRWGSAKSVHFTQVMKNGQSDTRGVIDILERTANTNNRFGTENDYTVRLIESKAFFKNAAEPFPRIGINGRSGVISRGDGTLADRPQPMYTSNSILFPADGTFQRDMAVSSLLAYEVYTLVRITAVYEQGGLYATIEAVIIISYTAGGDYVVVNTAVQTIASAIPNPISIDLTPFAGVGRVLRFRTAVTGGAGVTCRYTMSATPT